MAQISVKARVLTDGCNGRVRERLDRLPPDGRVRLVAVMLAAFAMLTFYTVGSSLRDIYNGRAHRLEVEHTRRVELEHRKQPSIDNFNPTNENGRREKDQSLEE